MPISACKPCQRGAIRSKPSIMVPWESFRAEIEEVVLTPDELKKSSAGRKPFDAILMFRMLVLQALNNLCADSRAFSYRLPMICATSSSASPVAQLQKSTFARR